MKLNLACGGNILPGFSNHDMDVDLTKLPLPYADNSVDYILLEHALEHFTVAQALAILDDLRRILKPGATLRVCCPVLERLDPVAGRDIALNHGHLMIFSTQSLKDFIRIAGFRDIRETRRSPLDGHHKVIGMAKDDRETARIEGRK